MKFFHNEKLSLGWAIAVELIVHGLFAAGAFLLGGFLGDVALSGILGPQLATAIGAWGLGLFIFGAAFQAFVLGEYMREHVESFEATSKGNGSYIRSWKHVRWLVGGIELSSLAFRCLYSAQQGDVRQAAIVGVFGILALYYAFAQAKVIHASVNRPVEYDVSRARESAGKDLVQGAMGLVPKMSPEQKQRFYTGDLGALSEIYESEQERKQAKLQPKEKKRTKERERQRSQEEGYRIAKGYTDRLLGGDERPLPDYPFQTAQSNQANHLSQNGNQNRK